jgi:hypothetical protein
MCLDELIFDVHHEILYDVTKNKHHNFHRHITFTTFNGDWDWKWGEFEGTLFQYYTSEEFPDIAKRLNIAAVYLSLANS